MRIAVIGPLEVQTDYFAPIPVPGAKERLLLGVLVAGAPGVVSIDVLAESLWDGDPPASARKTLQIHVVRLRRSLEPDRPRGSPGRFVVRRGPGYALALPRDAVDSLRIGDLAARGHALLAGGRSEEAAAEFEAAVGLWRGEPYADWPDASFAEAERRRISEVRAGAQIGFMDARLKAGRHAEVLPELERLVTEDPLREDWWRLLILALYRSGRQADALAGARRARTLLAEELGTVPGPALRHMEAAILAQDPALDLAAVRAPTQGLPAPADIVARGACPYKGLAAYQVEDAALFHGRERLVRGLVARLVDAPVLLVSGPSGAGKSSAVRAGLVPALAGGALPGSKAWRPVIVTPEASPVDVLAELAGDQPPSAPVLLVCDQFEELWAPRMDPAERTAFLDTVLGLVDDGIVARCVVVVRGDHVGRLAEHPPFTERIGNAFALVPALTETELREIVREPARVVGLRVDPELTDAVVTDVLGQVGALPLLSTALVGTWERRRGDRLTLAGYLEAGGVEGALTRSAEAAYGALDENGRGLARRLFVRLAETDDRGALVRRPLPLAELELAGQGGDARRAVVEAFVDRRLLAVDGDRLEVAHEALLTAWPRLARWLEEDAVGRAVRRHLAPAARDWEAGNQPDDELYRGARLAAALDWAAGPDIELTPVEQRFLGASRARADAELTAAQRRANREAAARRRTRRLAVGLAAVLSLALVATVLAVRAQQHAQEASLIADANRLAALSSTAASLDVSLLLAAEAVRLADTPETQDALLAALTEHGRAEHAAPFPGNDVLGAGLTDGGRTLLFGNGSQIVAWDIAPSSQPEVAFVIQGSWQSFAPSPTDDVVMAVEDNGGTYSLRIFSRDGSSALLEDGDQLGGRPVGGTFTPDGRRVLLLAVTPDTAAPDMAAGWTVTDFDAVDGTTRDPVISGTIPVPVATRLAADFSDDGSLAVLWNFDDPTDAVLIDLANGRHAPIPAPNRPGRIVTIRTLGSGAAQLWDDGGVTLLRPDGSVRQQLDVHQETVRDVVISPDGSWAATVGDGPTMILWDVDPSTGRWSQRERLIGHGADVQDAEVDPTGRRLVTLGLDHTVITWDMGPDGGFGESYPGLDGRWISNRPQSVPGGLIVFPTRPGRSTSEVRRESPGPDTVSVAAAFLNPATGEVVDQRVVGDTPQRVPFGSSVAVSPDESMVAVTWGLGTTVLDTRTRDVIKEIVLPPNGIPGFGNEPLPATVVWSAGWTPDGSTLLLGAEPNIRTNQGGYLVPVDTTTWQPGRPIDIGGAAATMEVSPDERLIAVATTASSHLVILDAATLEVQRRVPSSVDDRIYDLSFSADGRFLAGGGEQGLLHVFDTATWEYVTEPAAVQDDLLLQVEWLRDGRTVVTSGANGKVSLFDIERGQVRARPLRASGDPVEGYAHLVPGATDELIALSGERSGWRYPLQPADWLDEACTIVGRDLTDAEWARYLPGRTPEPTCSDQ